MAVRLTDAIPFSGRLEEYTDPIRPEFDWVGQFDDGRLDRNTWMYPWEGTGVYHIAVSSTGTAKIADHIGMFHTLPSRPVRRTGTGRAKTFTDLFYGRLQINPSYLNLGNILNDQTREVELWNANFIPVTVTQIIKQNDDGVELSVPVATPFVLQPLQAITIDVGVSTVGPTNMDALFTFDAAEVNDVQLQVVGTRAVVFSLLPDTSKTYSEKMSWVSGLITAEDGTEQRSALNEYPDTIISMTVQQQQEQIHNLDSLLWGWQHRVYSLPLWHRGTHLSEPAYEAGSVVFCDTAYAGFRVGGTAIIWASYTQFETFEITDIQPDRLIPKRLLQGSWPKGCVVAACRPARLPQETNSNWTHADLAEFPLQFVFTDVEQEIPFEYAESYRGNPVMLIQPNQVSALAEKNVRNIDAFETDLKARFTILNNDVPYVVRSHAWFLKGKKKIDEYRRWLYSRRGRVVPFWYPSWKNDITLAARIEQGSVDIQIKTINYRSMYVSRVGREDIIIFLKNGTHLIRRITTVSAGYTGDTEILSLDQEIPSTIEVNQIRMISFIGLNRLDADEVELDWRSDKLVLSNQNMRLLTDGV